MAKYLIPLGFIVVVSLAGVFNLVYGVYLYRKNSTGIIRFKAYIAITTGILMSLMTLALIVDEVRRLF